MYINHDRFLMVRAELYDLCDTLHLTDFEASPVQFLMRLEQIRATASHHGLTAIAEIASTYEAAMQRVQAHSKGQAITDSFGEILRDAIGVAHDLVADSVGDRILQDLAFFKAHRPDTAVDAPAT